MKNLLLLLSTSCLALPPCLGFQAPRRLMNFNRRVSTMRNADIASSPSISMLDTAVATPKSNQVKTQDSISSSRIIQLQQRQINAVTIPPTSPPLDSTSTIRNEDAVYKKGLVTIGFITLLFASNSPVLHMVFVNSSSPPPVFLLNAACSVVALGCMLAAGPLMNQTVDQPSLWKAKANEQQQQQTTPAPSTTGPTARFVDQISRLLLGANEGLTLQAGVELGLWKFLGTLANIYGLSETSASHGAFLIQLTTLFVPLAQGIMGVPIPRVIWTAIALALAGVGIFTQDHTNGGVSLMGDLACVVAAVFYATYDLRLFHWGKLVDPLHLITTKIVTQTILSLGILISFAWEPSVAFFQSAADTNHWSLFLLATLWSGVAVNAVAPFLQVGGQQAVGPARAQILYASQPLWAAILSWVVLNETVGLMGGLGGTLFLSAIYLAATADSPDPNCEKDICET